MNTPLRALWPAASVWPARTPSPGPAGRARSHHRCRHHRHHPPAADHYGWCRSPSHAAKPLLQRLVQPIIRAGHSGAAHLAACLCRRPEAHVHIAHRQLAGHLGRQRLRLALQKLAPRLRDLPAAPPRTARQPRPLQPVVCPSRPVPVDRLRTAGQQRFNELVVGGNGHGATRSRRWLCLQGSSVSRISARIEQIGLVMAAADQELLRLRALARRRPLQSRIIRSVASSTAIETHQPIHSIEAQLLASQPLVINRRPVTLA
jgi:hypothetical protein